MGVFADRGSAEPSDAQATRLQRVASDAVVNRLPITSMRPNTVVKVVSAHLMIEHGDDSIAQFYVSRTRRLDRASESTYD